MSKPELGKEQQRRQPRVQKASTEIKSPLARLEEGAAYLNVSVPYMRKGVANGLFATVRCGRAIRIPWAELERFVAERTTPARTA
jgi:excisionase family DNA binding protein